MTHEKYFHTFYRVNTGYTANGISKERAEAFYSEIKKRFTANGWEYHEPKMSGACPTITKGKTRLYCHPTALSGPVEESILKSHEVENILTDKSFETFALCPYRFVGRDVYDELMDWNDTEYQQYLVRKQPEIEKALLNAFTTKRKDLFRSEGACFNVAKSFNVKRLTNYLTYTSSDPEQTFTKKLLDQLVETGKIMKVKIPNKGYCYRTIKTNGK